MHASRTVSALLPLLVAVSACGHDTASSLHYDHSHHFEGARCQDLASLADARAEKIGVLVAQQFLHSAPMGSAQGGPYFVSRDPAQTPARANTEWGMHLTAVETATTQASRTFSGDGFTLVVDVSRLDLATHFGSQITDGTLSLDGVLTASGTATPGPLRSELEPYLHTNRAVALDHVAMKCTLNPFRS